MPEIPPGGSGAGSGAENIFTRVVEAKTTDYTINGTTDKNKIFTNEEAGGQVIFTLPDPSIGDGLTFTFFVREGNSVYIFTDDNTFGERIRIQGDESMDGGNIFCATEGCFVTLVSFTAGGGGAGWMAINVGGGWNIDEPI